MHNTRETKSNENFLRSVGIAGLALFGAGAAAYWATRSDSSSLSPEAARPTASRQGDGTLANPVDDLADVSFGNDRESVQPLTELGSTQSPQAISITNDAGIYGYVQDSLGNKIAGEDVKLVFADGEEVIVKTDSNGFFCVDGKPGGDVRIEVPSVNAQMQHVTSQTKLRDAPLVVLKPLPLIEECAETAGVSLDAEQFYLNPLEPVNLGTEWHRGNSRYMPGQTFTYQLTNGEILGVSLIEYLPTGPTTPVAIRVIEDGLPLTDANVMITTPGPFNGIRFMEGGNTNSDGIRDFNLKSGFRYLITVTTNPKQQEDRSVQVLNTTGTQSEFSIPLGDRQPRTIDHVLSQGKITGRVIDQNYEPFTDLEVRIGTTSCFTNNDGRFTFKGVSEDLEYDLYIETLVNWAGRTNESSIPYELPYPMSTTIEGTGPEDLGDIVLTRPVTWSVVFDATPFIMQSSGLPKEQINFDSYMLTIEYPEGDAIATYEIPGAMYPYTMTTPPGVTPDIEFNFAISGGHLKDKVTHTVKYSPSTSADKTEVVQLFMNN